MKILNTFTRSMLWDSSTNSISSSRLMMIGGGALFVWMVIVVTIIIIHSYFHYGPERIPNLSWYLYGAGGGAMSGLTGYGLNRFTADKQKCEPGITGASVQVDNGPDPESEENAEPEADPRDDVANELSEGEGA